MAQQRRPSPSPLPSFKPPTPTNRRATTEQASNSSLSSRGRSSQRSLSSGKASAATNNISGVQPVAHAGATARARSSSKSSSHRGRSNSQSRPPPTRNNASHHNQRARSRSRSASLTRVTGPGTVASAPRSSIPVASNGPPSRSNTPRGVRSVGPGITFEECKRGTAIGFEFSFDQDEPRNARAPKGERPSGSNTAQSNAKPKPGILDKLFGAPTESPPAATARQTLHQPTVRPRVLLAATVYYNTATNLWIATINTNQRGVARDPATANRYLQAFSFQTEREAREAAIANAPPKMVPFGESPSCFQCHSLFALFRRAAHCRNCGVCVCHSCSVVWPSQTLPPTYNLKKESTVRVCQNCHGLSVSFKNALLDGNYEEAVALYGTGNINLRTPFPVGTKKDEVLYPIHCAVMGGSLDVLRWLLDDHHCPIQRVRGKGRHSRIGGTGPNPGGDPILTSKGRSVLSIALGIAKVDVLRYLVIECDVSVYESTNLKDALRALEAVLAALPSASSVPRAAAVAATRSTVVPHQSTGTAPNLLRGELPPVARWDQASCDNDDDDASVSSEEQGDGHEHENSSRPSEWGSKKSHRTRGSSATTTTTTKSHRSASSSKGRTISSATNIGVATSEVPSCILCFDRPIDSRCRPCGHEICCVECATRLAVCPICGASGTFGPLTTGKDYTEL